MEDLVSKTLVKVMWLPGEESLLWDMKTESQIYSNLVENRLLWDYIDLNRWSKQYGDIYQKWLDEDLREIFDLTCDIIQQVLSAIKKVNSTSEDIKYFYWYDLDRTLENQEFKWFLSPLSGDELIDLGSNYHYLNRLVSLKDYLVFPRY